MAQLRVSEAEILDAKSVDLAAMMNLKFTRKGRALWACCPFHKEKTPSFKVEDGRYICFGCGKRGDAISWAQEAEHLSFAEAVQKLARHNHSPARFGGVKMRETVRYDEEGRNKKLRACEIWDSAQPIAGTHAQAYLRARGIRLPPSPELRFLPEDYHRESGRRLPCLLARLSGEDGFVAVQRTYLDPTLPKKAGVDPPKKTLGRMERSAVRLKMPAGDRLGVAEGIETALSAQQLYSMAVWAVCGCQRFSAIQIPPQIRFIAVFGDDGAEGRKAAEDAALMYDSRGYHVEIYFPQSHYAAADGSDFNDVLRAQI
jgi:DNA primase